MATAHAGRGKPGMVGRERDTRRWWRSGPDRPPIDRTRLLGCLFGGAMAASPFLALLYGPTAGLAVAAAALTATAGLTVDAARAAPPATRRRLLVVASVNAALALTCLVALIARLG